MAMPDALVTFRAMSTETAVVGLFVPAIEFSEFTAPVIAGVAAKTAPLFQPADFQGDKLLVTAAAFGVGQLASAAVRGRCAECGGSRPMGPSHVVSLLDRLNFGLDSIRAAECLPVAGFSGRHPAIPRMCPLISGTESPGQV